MSFEEQSGRMEATDPPPPSLPRPSAPVSTGGGQPMAKMTNAQIGGGKPPSRASEEPRPKPVIKKVASEDSFDREMCVASLHVDLALHRPFPLPRLPSLSSLPLYHSTPPPLHPSHTCPSTLLLPPSTFSPSHSFLQGGGAWRGGLLVF